MSKCKGCPFWKWVRKDTLYDTRGFHYCEKNELTTCKRRNEK